MSLCRVVQASLYIYINILIRHDTFKDTKLPNYTNT